MAEADSSESGEDLTFKTPSFILLCSCGVAGCNVWLSRFFSCLDSHTLQPATPQEHELRFLPGTYASGRQLQHSSLGRTPRGAQCSRTPEDGHRAVRKKGCPRKAKARNQVLGNVCWQPDPPLLQPGGRRNTPTAAQYVFHTQSQDSP